MEKVGGALRVGSGGEDSALVVLEDVEPGCNVGGGVEERQPSLGLSYNRIIKKGKEAGECSLKSVHSEKYGIFLKVMIAARQGASLTQQQLADVLGKPQSYVSKYERGERRLDVIEFLEIATALKLDAASVIDELRKTGKSAKAGGRRG